jgi:hypothetical protein
MGIRSYTCSRASRSRRTLCPKCVKTTKAAERTTNEVVYSVQRLPPPSAVVLFFFECGSISDILEETCEETRWAVRRTPVRSARSQENSTAATSPGARHSLFVCKMDNIFDSLLPAVDSNEEWRDICSAVVPRPPPVASFSLCGLRLFVIKRICLSVLLRLQASRWCFPSCVVNAGIPQLEGE